VPLHERRYLDEDKLEDGLVAKKNYLPVFKCDFACRRYYRRGDIR